MEETVQPAQPAQPVKEPSKFSLKYVLVAGVVIIFVGLGLFFITKSVAVPQPTDTPSPPEETGPIYHISGSIVPNNQANFANSAVWNFDITAVATAGRVKEMLVWTNLESEDDAVWQPYAFSVQVPRVAGQEFVNVRFRDDFGTLSDIYTNIVDPNSEL